MDQFTSNLPLLQLALKAYNSTNTLLTYEEVLVDNKLCKKYQKQLQQLEPLAVPYQTYLNLQTELQNLRKIICTSADEQALINQEISQLNIKIQNVKKQILKNIKTIDAKIQRAIIEVSKGTGQNAQQLFNDIVAGYKNYFSNSGFEITENSTSTNTTFDIIAQNVKDIMLPETGLHVAKINGQQSTCLVFVYGAYQQSEPTFAEQDIKIEICRSSGAGGQHINTTDSAIKITHLPTGITAVCQSERSQYQNKQTAMQNLKTKVLNYYNKQKNNFEAEQKKEQVKLVKKGHVAKVYDYDIKKIICKTTSKTVLLADFLNGNDL